MQTWNTRAVTSTVGKKACPECSHSCEVDAQYCPNCGFPIGAVNLNEQDSLIGSVLPGSYQVLDLLGVGGMGRVYRAEQRTLGRTVAIKVIHPHLAADEKSLARFLTEARATSKLNHPNSVSVIDFGKTNQGQPYLVMEFLRGRNLAQVVGSDGLLRIPRIVNVLRQVLAALAEAHELNIIHRDLKPENIVLEPLRRGGDFVKVVDFGLAKLRAEDTTTEITLPGIVCGTPDFMAPEQGRGDPLDGRSDLYAVGVVLFWLLTGRLPFEASSPTQVVMMHITMPAPDPREFAPTREIPDSIIAVLTKALAKDPSQRFADALEFSDALERAQWGTRPSVPPSAPAGPRSDVPAARDGKGLNLPGRAVACPGCGHLVPHASFCFDCGTRLPRDTERPPSRPKLHAALSLVGREEELRWLFGQWERASTGLQAVRLVGDAGSGKTRLLDEFCARVQERGSMVVKVGPDPYWAEVSGYVLRDLIRKLVPREHADRPTAPRRVVAEILNELLHGQYPSSLSADERQQGYAETLRWSMERVTSDNGAPLVVILDDLDRIDPLSRQAVAGCLRDWTAGGVLAVAAHHARFNERWGHDKLRVLTGLPAHAATELLRRATNGGPAITLAEVGSAGIPPLYVEQILSFGLEGGSDPPARLADLIAERLASLGPSERRKAQALAVLGDRVLPSTLARFLGDERELDSDADILQLVKANIVKFEDDDSLSLAHPLFHELTLLATPAEARRELHRQAARVYRKEGAPLEVLAEHAVLSNDPLVALTLLEQAATEAEKRGDDLTATNLLRRGLDVARKEIYRGELDDPMRAIVIFGRKLGAALTRRGHFSDAKGVLAEVLDNTPPVGLERIEVLAQLAEVAQRREQSSEAERYLAQALEVADRSQVPAGLREGLELRRLGLRATPSARPRA